MNVTVVGGGNVGTQFAVHCAEKGYLVTIYTKQPEKFRKELQIINQEGDVVHRGTIICATKCAKVAFAEADIIFVTVPSFCMKDIAKEISSYAKAGLKIGLIPGTGGGECAFRKCVEKGCTIFGLQRVPSVARLVEYGSVVKAIGYRSLLHVAAMPKDKTKECCILIKKIFDIECEALDNYLNLTLTPSNPILHTNRLYIIFKDYFVGKVYEQVPLFYEEWDDETSKLIFTCDEEVQEICRRIDAVQLRQVKSLKIHYESETPVMLTQKIRSIQGFKGLKTPVKEVNRKYIPDLQSRYFTADFSYGLSIILQIAKFVNYDASNIKKVMEWYRNIAIENDEFSYSEYEIYNFEQFKKFYELI